MKRHLKVETPFKEEPNQSMELCRTLAVKLNLEGDIKREPTVKDPKRGKNKMKLKQLSKKQRAAEAQCVQVT